MTMPEASVDKYNGAVFWKDDIGPSRQASSAQAIAKSPRVESPADQDLQLGIRSTYPGHLGGPLLGRETVDQS